MDQWVSSWAALGVKMDPMTWKIILPVGISFYTFQTLSYSVDVYRKQIPPCRDFVAFATYVSFFPQLVAGPIERATRLLPQMLQERKLNAISVRVGWRLICWGVFKKVVIADSAAMYANAAFGNDAVAGPVMVLGVVAFALQIYGDFSGYSDIAIGTARLFGIRLRSNFRVPLLLPRPGRVLEALARVPQHLVPRLPVHPLGGSRMGRGRSLLNVVLVFLVSGLWHGADWKFVTWGGIHAACFVPLFLLGRNRQPERAWHWRQLPAALWTFTMVCLAWVFFRANNFDHACDVLSRMASGWTSSGDHPLVIHDEILGTGPQRHALRLGPPRTAHLPPGPCRVLGRRVGTIQERRALDVARGVARGLAGSLMLLLALVFGTRHAAQEFIYFAF